MNLVCFNCKSLLMLVDHEGLEQDSEGNLLYIGEHYCERCGLRLKTKIAVEVLGGTITEVVKP